MYHIHGHLRVEAYSDKEDHRSTSTYNGNNPVDVAKK